jgi:hypothetical protein
MLNTQEFNETPVPTLLSNKKHKGNENLFEMRYKYFQEALNDGLNT